MTVHEILHLSLDMNVHFFMIDYCICISISDDDNDEES